MQPAIRPLSQVRIDQGHFISDVLFDNIFVRNSWATAIKASWRHLLTRLPRLIWLNMTGSKAVICRFSKQLRN